MSRHPGANRWYLSLGLAAVLHVGAFQAALASSGPSNDSAPNDVQVVVFTLPAPVSPAQPTESRSPTAKPRAPSPQNDHPTTDKSSSEAAPKHPIPTPARQRGVSKSSANPPAHAIEPLRPTVAPAAVEQHGSDRHVAATARPDPNEGLASTSLPLEGSPQGAGTGAGRPGFGGNADGTSNGGAQGGGVAQAPRLLSAPNVCRGLFPYQAEASRGVVALSVRVDATGRAKSGAVFRHAPESQGFTESALACVPRLKFQPAADPAGHPIASTARVRLVFER